MNLTYYKYGFIMKRAKGLFSRPRCLDEVKRSRITSFSAASRRRLREYLISHHVPGYTIYGVTLTLPWHCSDWSKCMSDFREVMHRFRTSWNRAFPDCGAVYRVELQQRGAPHLHLISFHSNSTSKAQIADKYWYLWFRALGTNHTFSYDDFFSYCIRFDDIPNTVAMIRYLSEHASKSKQAQLGYQGKQWGILGRKNFELIESTDVQVSDEVKFKRVLARLNRRRVKDSRSPFGYKYKRLKRFRSTNFLRIDTLLRIVKSLQ